MIFFFFFPQARDSPLLSPPADPKSNTLIGRECGTCGQRQPKVFAFPYFHINTRIREKTQRKLPKSALSCATRFCFRNLMEGGLAAVKQKKNLFFQPPLPLIKFLWRSEAIELKQLLPPSKAPVENPGNCRIKCCKSERLLTFLMPPTPLPPLSWQIWGGGGCGVGSPFRRPSKEQLVRVDT